VISIYRLYDFSDHVRSDDKLGHPTLVGVNGRERETSLVPVAEIQIPCDLWQLFERLQVGEASCFAC